MSKAETNEDREYRRLYALSAEIGELLQRKASSPVTASMVLMITLGRLVAREGYAHLTPDSRDVFLNPKVWNAYKWGFNEERARGHMGRPGGN